MNQKEKKQYNLCLTSIHLLEGTASQQTASGGGFILAAVRVAKLS